MASPAADSGITAGLPENQGKPGAVIGPGRHPTHRAAPPTAAAPSAPADGWTSAGAGPVPLGLLRSCPPPPPGPGSACWRWASQVR
jgi:hypothetical protein